MNMIQKGDRVELISRKECTDIPIGARGSVIHTNNLTHGFVAVHIIWDLKYGQNGEHKGSVIYEDKQAGLQNIRVLTGEEVSQEQARSKTWYEAIQEFTPNEMRAFLELVRSGEMDQVFCRNVCEHGKDRKACVSACLYPHESYISHLLSSHMPLSEQQYIKRKGEEYDSKNSD